MLFIKKKERKETMLRGFDFSKHNNDNIFEDGLKKGDFIIIKATEGRTYTDPKFHERIPRIKDGLCGAYHYARPDNNTAEKEVENFYNAIKPYLSDTMITVLDWEGNALNYSFDWALKFCKLLEEKTHRPCIIYGSASVIKKYASQWKYWWTAHYYKCEDGCSHDNVEEVLTQYTSTPYDMDVFHGNREDWLVLCGGKKDVTTKVLVEWKENGKTYKVICEG